MTMGLGKTIRELRLARGWTLEQLEAKSGVAVGTISALEMRDSARSQYFPALAKALGVSVEQLAAKPPEPAAATLAPDQQPDVSDDDLRRRTKWMGHEVGKLTVAEDGEFSPRFNAAKLPKPGDYVLVAVPARKGPPPDDILRQELDEIITAHRPTRREEISAALRRFKKRQEAKE